MTKIIPNQDFLDDRDRYEEGTEYDVPEDKARYFVRNGWADSDEINESADVPAEAGLDVHDSTNGQTATT
jgi:hypothetical protein